MITRGRQPLTDLAVAIEQRIGVQAVSEISLKQRLAEAGLFIVSPSYASIMLAYDEMVR